MANGLPQNVFNFEDFLETQPQSVYQSFVTDPQAGMTANMKRYYQNQFNQIQNEYIGKLAREMRQGKLPTQSFQDFLGNPETGVFRMPDQSGRQIRGYERFRRQSPYARSAYSQGPYAQNIFAPSTRWITY